MVPLIHVPTVVKFMCQKIEWWLPEAGTRGNGSYFISRVSVWGDEKVLEVDGCEGYITMWTYLMALKHTPKTG